MATARRRHRCPGRALRAWLLFGVAPLSACGVAVEGPDSDAAPPGVDSDARRDTGAPGDTDALGGSESGDSGSGDTSAPAPALSLALSEHLPVAIQARWTGPEGGVVHFGIGDQELGVVSATPEEGGGWSALLVGAPPEQEVWVTLEGAVDAGEAATIETGPPPWWWSAPTARDGERSGLVLTQLLSLADGAFHPVALNADGEPVWWHTYASPRELYGSRVRRSADGSRLYYNIFQIDIVEADAFNGLVVVGLDGEQLEEIALPTAHHDFWLHDDGAIAYLSYDIRPVGAYSVMGDALVVRSSDGEERVLWSIWDDLEPPDVVGGDTAWGHANAIQYLPDEDAYLIGFRELSSIFAIDAATGERRWSMGLVDPTLALSEPFEGQHGFDLVGDDLFVFDNQNSLQSSRISRYTLDLAGRSVELSWQHAPADRYTAHFGDVCAVGDALLVSWGHEGLLEQLSADGESGWSLQWEGSATVGFLAPVDGL